MYIYDIVVIFSFMWYVLRFEHAHGLKRYNDRRMTRGQTTCSLGGIASLTNSLGQATYAGIT